MLNLLKNLDVEIYEGDLTNIGSLKKLPKDLEVVFHLAAIARPMEIPDKLYFEVNEKGTKNLLESLKENKKLKKIVMMSSISAVGQSLGGKPVNEKTECKPVDVYGWSKLAQEKVSLEYDLPIVFLRPPMVFGPRDFEMLRLFKAVDKRFFPINGEDKCLEFLYVENLVEACFLAWKKGKNKEAYHITNGEHYSINDIISSIEKAEKKKIIPIKLPNQVFYVGGIIMESMGKIFGFHPPFKRDTVKWMTERLWYSDDSKAKKVLGYKPIYSLDEGIKKTSEYYAKKGWISSKL
jgi:nucleoside-diphosphate-sugar epimerase